MRVLSADWVLPVAAPPIRDGAVAIDGDRIAAIGTREELGEGERFDESVILPGFVNAHAHLEYATYAGFGDGLPFDRWLIVHMERKAKLEDGDAVAIARLGAAESLRSGITTVADASFTGASAPACAELGLRAIVHLEVFGRSADAIAEQFEPKRERIADSLSDRVRLGISPHAPYTVTPELYAAALELGLPVQTHLAESAAEDEWLRFGTGSWTAHAHLLVDPPGRERHPPARPPRPARPAHRAPPTASSSTTRRSSCSPSTTSRSPTARARTRCSAAASRRSPRSPPPGVRVGLGTDSPASTPSFDMFEEMRAAVLLARASERDPGALLAKDALELATLRAASALDLDDEVGSLAPGKRADLTVVSLAGSAYLPWEDPAGAVVFGGTPERVELHPRRRRGAIPERRGDMAKTQTRRKKRTPPPAQRSAASAEDLMFFPRLRKRAKWVFLFLALAFAFGFVGFGVGAGGSGIGDYLADLFNRQPGTGTPSIDDAQARVDENPADADAQLDLANAYQLDGQTDKAIAALTAFLVIEPENTDALQQLASLYLTQQSEAQTAAQNAQALAGASAFEGLLFDPSGTVGPSLGGKITGVQRTESQGAYTDALIKSQEAATKEADTWEKLVALTPDEHVLPPLAGQRGHAGERSEPGRRRLRGLSRRRRPTIRTKSRSRTSSSSSRKLRTS